MAIDIQQFGIDVSAYQTATAGTQAPAGLTGMQQFALGAGALSSLFGALGALEQGKMQRSIARINAQMNEMKAEDAIERGREAESNYRKQIKQLIGKQKTSYAAQNVDLSAGGSAADVIAETAEVGEQDAMQIRINAMREAFGYRMGAQNAVAQGNMSRVQAMSNASATLLTGGSQLYSMWSKFGG